MTDITERLLELSADSCVVDRELLLDAVTEIKSLRLAPVCDCASECETRATALRLRRLLA